MEYVNVVAVRLRIGNVPLYGAWSAPAIVTRSPTL